MKVGGDVGFLHMRTQQNPKKIEWYRKMCTTCAPNESDHWLRLLVGSSSLSPLARPYSFSFWLPLSAVVLLPLHPRRFCGVCWGGGLVLMHHHRSTSRWLRCVWCRRMIPRPISIVDRSRHRHSSSESSFCFCRSNTDRLLRGKLREGLFWWVGNIIRGLRSRASVMILRAGWDEVGCSTLSTAIPILIYLHAVKWWRGMLVSIAVEWGMCRWCKFILRGSYHRVLLRGVWE